VPFADLSDIRLYYERGGDAGGPPLLFINGTGGDLRAEPSVMTWPIADGFDLLARTPPLGPRSSNSSEVRRDKDARAAVSLPQTR
jgi:pimeloyl-ACP methyl ester carboxylesterase